MHVLGIVGGVASGKSLVADELRKLGAAVLDGDKAGHAVLAEPEVSEMIRQRWGAGVIAADGQVNRRAVARIVFGPPPQGPKELAFLEQLTHPRIGARLAQELEQHRQFGDVPAVVIDAALLFRGGWDKLCDQAWFIDAPHASRVARAAARGWSAADLAAREAAQEPLDEKRRRCHAVIDNSGPPEQTRQQVQRLWEGLVG